MEFHISAYIPKSSSLDEVRHGLAIPLFARDQERMDQAGFKRIGSAHVVVHLDGSDELESVIAAARAAGVEA